MNIEQQNAQMREDFHRRGHTGKDIVVHVLDTGMNENRKEFLYSDKGIARSKIIASPYGQGGGHGEMVAGVILKWLPDARVVNWNVIGEGKWGTVTIIQGLMDVLEYVRSHPENIHVANMSLSGELEPGTDLIWRYEKAIDDLVKAGCSVFVSAGNDGKEITSKYPSCFESPITVAALGPDGTKADFSTWHNEVDFAELGIGVETIFQSESLFSVGHEMFAGTSAACPELLGKAGLIQSEYHDLTGGRLTDAQLYERLRGCAADLGAEGRDPYFGYGFIELKGKEGISMLVKISEFLNYFVPHAIITNGKTTNPPPDDQFGYMMGADGRVADDAYAKHRAQSSYPNDWQAYYEAYKKWIKHKDYDCNSVAEAFYKEKTGVNIDTKARYNFANWCSTKDAVTRDNKLENMPQLPGIAVYSGPTHSSAGITHVGFLLCKYGTGPNDWYVLECRGKDYGLVITTLQSREWEWWGVMDKRFEYDLDANWRPDCMKPEPAPEPLKPPRTLTLTQAEDGYMRIRLGPDTKYPYAGPSESAKVFLEEKVYALEEKNKWYKIVLWRNGMYIDGWTFGEGYKA